MFLNRHRDTFLRFLVLAGIIFILYLNSLANGFHYGDFDLFVNRSEITEAGSDLFSTVYAAGGRESELRKVLYRPVLLATFVLNYKWADGFDPRGFRLVNLFIHIFASTALFLLARELTLNSGAAFLSALFFAVTPVNSEVINYISARSMSLATLFSLLSIYLYMVMRRGRLLLFVPSLLFMLLALFTRPVAAVIPAILLVYDLYFLPERRMALVKRLWPYPLFLAVLAGYMKIIPVVDYLLDLFNGQGAREPYPNLLTNLFVTLKYIWMFFVPLGLSINHHVPIVNSISSSFAITGIVGNLLLAGLGVYFFFSGRKALSFCIVFFYMAMLPTVTVPLNIVFLESRGYFPLAGIAIISGSAANWMMTREHAAYAGRMKVVLVLLTVMAAFIVMDRNRDWKNSETLWLSALENNPESYRGRLQLGEYYEGSGDLDKAIVEYQKAVRGSPERVAPYVKIGAIYQKRGDFSRAEEMYRKALSARPGLEGGVLAHYNLALIYHQKGEYEGAESEYKQTIAADPFHYLAHYNLGNLYLDIKKYRQAIEEFNNTITINPGFIDTYYNIAAAYDTIGSSALAIQQYGKFIDKAPMSYLQHINNARQRVDQLSISRAGAAKPGTP